MIAQTCRKACATQSGITLIELLIVVVIIGILAGISYPSYRKQVLRSTRTDAKVSLQQIAQNLESCFTRFHAYDDPACTILTPLRAAGVLSNDRHYQITVKDEDDLVYTLVATPQGGQTADKECASFILDGTNKQDVSGTKHSTPAGIAQCWK